MKYTKIGLIITGVLFALISTGCATNKESSSSKAKDFSAVYTACKSPILAMKANGFQVLDSGHTLSATNVWSTDQADVLGCFFKEVGTSQGLVSRIASSSAGTDGSTTEDGVQYSWNGSTYQSVAGNTYPALSVTIQAVA